MSGTVFKKKRRGVFNFLCSSSIFFCLFAVEKGAKMSQKGAFFAVFCSFLAFFEFFWGKTARFFAFLCINESF